MLHQDHIGFVFTKYQICNVATFGSIRINSIVEGVVSSAERRPWMSTSRIVDRGGIDALHELLIRQSCRHY